MAMINKRGYIFLFALIAMAFLFVVGRQGEERSSSPTLEAGENQVQIGKKIVSTQINSQSGSSGGLILNENKGEQDLEVVKRWQLSRGILDKADLRGYENYNVETLESLVATGDFRAGERLIDIYLGDTDPKTLESSREKLRIIANRMAVIGSTHALFRLGLLYSSEAGGIIPEEAKRQKVIESMAYFKVQAMRGDFDGYYADLMQNGMSNRQAKYPLAENDYAEVSIVAQKIYDDLQQKRIELGLGQFDNSAPIEVQNYFKATDPRNWSDAKAKY